MGHVHQIIEESCFKLQEAIARCTPFCDDLEKIINFLSMEYDMLHSLSNYTKYNQFYLGFDECEFKRFPSVRLSEGESKEIKNAVKETRDSIKKAVSKLKEEFFSKPVDEVVKLIYECSPVVNELIDATLLFSDRFAQFKMESNVVDFYDVEHFALEILEDESTGAARVQREQYRSLLLHEYQDSK